MYILHTVTTGTMDSTPENCPLVTSCLQPRNIVRQQLVELLVVVPGVIYYNMIILQGIS